MNLLHIVLNYILFNNTSIFMLEQTINIILKAGNLVKQFRKNNNLIIETKKDQSIVTNADKESELFILDQIYSNFGKDQIILSEEAVALGKVPSIRSSDSFWLVDPIDATLSYAYGKNDYCINITYLSNYQPLLGLIYAPSINTLWYAEKNKGAFKVEKSSAPQRIYARTIPDNPIVVTSKKGHQLSTAILKQYNIGEELTVASAIKFCYIAEGKADYYFRKRNKACDWDIASGHIIVTESGGEIILTENTNYFYGIPPFLAPSLIVKGKSK